jgi:death-on-curing protein
MIERIWLGEPEVLALNDRLLALHGGAAGLRDQGLLQSALARPRQMAAYAATADIVDMAGALTIGIVKNHPFVDGNKRTGFVAGILFIELNGYRFTAPEDEAARAVLDLAASILEEAGYTAFLRANAPAQRK